METAPFSAPTTSNQRDSKLHLGPVIIHYICKGVNRTSALSQIAIVNGVLTVCSPEILLEDIVFSQNGVPQVSVRVPGTRLLQNFDLVRVHLFTTSS